MSSRGKSTKKRTQTNPNSLANLTKGGPGRKPIPKEIKKMFESACPDAVRLLINTMMDEDTKIDLRIDCANEVLNRGIGKPLQQVDVTSDNEPLQVIFNIPRPTKKEDDSNED